MTSKVYKCNNKDDKYGFYDSDGKKVHKGWKNNFVLPNIYEDDFIMIYYITRTECTKFYEQYAHKNKDFEISIILDGKAIFKIDNENHFVSHKSLIIVNENQYHSCFPLDITSFKMLCWNFGFKRMPENSLETKIYEGFKNLKNNIFHDVNKLSGLHENILDDLQLETLYKNELIKLNVYDYLINVLICVEKSENEVAPKKLSDKIKDYIGTTTNDRVSPAELSSVFMFSESYIAKVFKKETGMGVNQYHNFVKLETAKEMLLCTDKSITEIARALNYTDVQYFCKTFKEHFKITPNLFRKNAK